MKRTHENNRIVLCKCNNAKSKVTTEVYPMCWQKKMAKTWICWDLEAKVFESRKKEVPVAPVDKYKFVIRHGAKPKEKSLKKNKYQLERNASDQSFNLQFPDVMSPLQSPIPHPVLNPQTMELNKHLKIILRPLLSLSPVQIVSGQESESFNRATLQDSTDNINLHIFGQFFFLNRIRAIFNGWRRVLKKPSYFAYFH